MIPEISIVIPLYNEADNVKPLYRDLTPVLENLGQTYEVIVIDDGSTDGSFDHLKAIQQKASNWKLIRFRRNFGQTAAFAAGFLAASGKIVVTLDADLQNDPRDIPKLLKKMAEGYDIVSGWRLKRKESFLKRRLPSILANRLISKVTGVVLHDYGCSLKAYRSEVVKNVKLYGELHRFIPGIASWMGITVAEIPVNDRKRLHGKSKVGIDRTFRVLLDIILVGFLLKYVNRPLHIFGGLGLIMSVWGIFLGLYLTFIKLILSQDIGHRPLLLLSILLIVLGVQMVGSGILSELIIRTYNESQNKPIYMVKEIVGRDVGVIPLVLQHENARDREFKPLSS